MYPHESTYPFFEANQVLKKDDLNNLFEYLDEQSRMTRTNLIGIGIVCGMDIIPTATNKIKITKGVGVTSEGYLVTIPEVEYVNYKVYPANKDIFLGDDCYTETHQIGKNKLHKFVDGTPPDNNQLFELVEGSPTGFSALTATFLADKVVLVYVELSKNGLRNCSPNSCDDKGTEISVNFRRFLITKANADLIRTEANALVGTQTNIDIEKIIAAKLLLPDIRLKRFDVPNTSPVTTTDFVVAYQKILTKAFIEDILRANLVKLFEAYEAILTGLDKTVIQNWVASYGGASVQLAKPYEYQYFYDFISDLLLNYHEIRTKGFEVLALCNPDCRMFPRHLFLGEATVDTTKTRNSYRQYFIPSPIIGNQKKLGDELRLLFERLLGLIKNYKIPQPAKLAIEGRLLDANIRITPSKLGDVVLSKKAIPYYYEVNTGTPKLYESWSFDLKNQAKEKQNLSYHAGLYANAGDDFVLNPLEYDLEPYNFLRIEGIVGKPYQDVLAAVNQYILNERLPFDVVALSTGNESLSTAANPEDFQCQFADLETIYDVQRSELICLLRDMVREGTTAITPALFPKDLAGYTPEAIAEIRAVLSNANIPDALECKIQIIVGLLAVYRKRLEKLKAEFIFSNYTKKNPGIQHKAGVPSGGTFIIVYHGTLQSVYEKDVTLELREEIANSRTKRLARAVVGEATASTTGTTVTGVADTSSGQNILGLSQTLMLQIEALPSAIQEEIKNTIEQQVANAYATAENVGIDSGIVFADFFLPYRCCVECTPVQVVTPPKPAAVKADLSEPQCDESNKNFSVTISISGGTPPYTSDKGTVTGNTLVINTESGKSQTVTITDADNQTVQVTIPVHSCDQPCDLPCGGKAERCFYPAWVGKPAKGVPAKLTFVEVAGLEVVDTENNKNFRIDFREEFKAVFEQLDDSLYIQAFEEIVKIINEKIAAEMGDDKSFIVGFDRELELLTIEHYVCHDFNLRLNWGFEINGKEIVFDAEYNQNSWRIDSETGNTKGAKFGCVRLDKCKGTEQELCKKQIDPDTIKLVLRKRGEKFEYSFESPTNPDAILWIFENEVPEYSNSDSGSFVSRLDIVETRFIFIKGACFVVIKGTAPNQ